MNGWLTCSEARQRTRQRARRNVLSSPFDDTWACARTSETTRWMNKNAVIHQCQRFIGDVEPMLYWRWSSWGTRLIASPALPANGSHSYLTSLSTYIGQLVQLTMVLFCAACETPSYNAAPSLARWPTSMHLWWHHGRRCFSGCCCSLLWHRSARSPASKYVESRDRYSSVRPSEISGARTIDALCWDD